MDFDSSYIKESKNMCLLFEHSFLELKVFQERGVNYNEHINNWVGLMFLTAPCLFAAPNAPITNNGSSINESIAH